MNVLRRLSTKKGFTLLELLVVIIIIGVIVSLALPNFFRLIEFSRGNEALNASISLRSAIERCYMRNNQSYTTCVTMANLDIADPGAATGQPHFTYAITSGAADYTITATRNTMRGGAVGSTITFVVTPTGVLRTGASAFSGI
jgi:type IV pilus assembly protein PilE